MIGWSVLPNSPLSIYIVVRVAFQFSVAAATRSASTSLRATFGELQDVQVNHLHAQPQSGFACAPFGHCVTFGPSSCDTHATCLTIRGAFDISATIPLRV